MRFLTTLTGGLACAALVLAACQSSVAQPAVADPAAQTARSEMPSGKGQGPYLGGIGASDGTPILVQYREVHGRAVIGGDMVVGSHREMQRRSAAFINTIDRRSLAAPQRRLADRAAQALSLRRNEGASRKSLTAARAVLGWGTLGTPWPVRVIPYAIDNSIPDGFRRDRIRTAVANWNAQAPIRLRLASEMSDEERGETATLTFVDHEDDDSLFACSSNVGYTPDPLDGTQKLWLNPDCEVGNIMHEIGHATGLEHEHQRTDRAALITLAATAPADDNYATLAGRQLSGHDLCSIMHYAPGTEDPDWFTLTEAGIRSHRLCRAPLPANCQIVGQRCQLSAADRTSLAVLYPPLR
jgi:hypothetical protein